MHGPVLACETAYPYGYADKRAAENDVKRQVKRYFVWPAWGKTETDKTKYHSHECADD